MKYEPKETDKQFQVSIVNLSAVRNYAEAIILHNAGMLSRLYTGAYTGKGWLKFATNCMPIFKQLRMSGKLRRRKCCLPNNKITAFNTLDILGNIKRRIYSHRKFDNTLWMGKTSCSSVASKIVNDPADAVICLPGSYEIFKKAKESGKMCIIDQNSAAMEHEMEIMDEEQLRRPGWEIPQKETPSKHIILERRQKSREYADGVICPSEFVAASLKGKLNPETEITLVPYCARSEIFTYIQKIPEPTRPLRILFAGSIRLQKGIQYLLEAAKILGRSVEGRVVGPNLLNPQKAREISLKNVEFTGAVAHSEMHKHYNWADVLCLPSLCEGSAGVVFEALSSGVPVICTPNTGSVVRDGKDGFIVPIRDAEAIAEKIELLCHNRNLIAEMSKNARRRAEEFDMEQYGKRYINAIVNILSGKSKTNIAPELLTVCD